MRSIRLVCVVLSVLFGSSEELRSQDWFENPAANLDVLREEIDTVWRKPSARSDSSTGCCITISISYPVLGGQLSEETISNLNSIIRRFVDHNLTIEPGASLQERVAREVDTLRQLWLDFPQDKPSKYIMNITSVWFGPGIMGLQMEEKSYPGGYRTRERGVACNYDLRNFAPLALDRLFIDDYRNRLDSMGEVSFRLLRKLPKKGALKKHGFF